jgi:hypothetical protein
LWKRQLDGVDWVRVSDLGSTPTELFVSVVQGTAMLTAFNTSCGVACPQVDFVEMATGIRVPAFANQLFGELNWYNDLNVIPKRQ